MKVMIVVTHLLGTGHLRRALTLSHAFAKARHDVHLVSGGRDVAGLDRNRLTWHQLPPLHSDGVNFTRLLDEDGTIAKDSHLAKRQQTLCAALTDVAPDILITELFPFGRRVLSDEFLALLTTAHMAKRSPVVLASVRDILAPPSKLSKADRTDQIIAQYYDAVLVHSDFHSTPLEHSWPVSAPLRTKLFYTGYVAPDAPAPHPGEAGKGEILVSAGGGDVGTALFEAAIAAAALLPDRRWRLLVGGADVANRIAALGQLPTAGNVIIEPTRPDFRQMLLHAAVSISLCGYNTALDVLQAGTPAVFVPFDDGGEVEQTLRARSLAHLPGISILPAAETTPDRLCASVSAMIAAPARDPEALQFDGAAQSVAMAEQMAKARV